MENILDIKNKIINIIKSKGPSLPVEIASQIEKTSIITSAFLSELVSEKEIKISQMKVGGSPLYFFQGQEKKLENFQKHLHFREKEAIQLLKQNKILQDDKQTPPIRVALRNLEDFAYPINVKMRDEQILFWRYLTFPEQEAKKQVESIIKPTEKKELPKQKIIKSEKATIKTKQKPLLEINQAKPKKTKVKEKSDFVKQIILFLEQKNIELLEEKDFKKREFTGIVRINTDLGKLRLFCIAKNKKKITENDLTLALQKTQTEKMPALLITPGELNKKAQPYLQEHVNLITLIRLQ